LIRKLGFNDVDWRTLIALLIAVGSVVFAMVSLPLIVNRQKRDPLKVVYVKLCQLMKQQGYPRAIHEGPRDYRARLTAASSTLKPEKKIVVDRFLMLYEAAQYGTVRTASNNAVISQLNTLLSQCR
jgi:hypothetical protein